MNDLTLDDIKELSAYDIMGNIFTEYPDTSVIYRLAKAYEAEFKALPMDKDDYYRKDQWAFDDLEEEFKNELKEKIK